MSRIVKRTLILAAVFLAALGVYLIMAQRTMDKSEAVYTVMEDPTLPVVYLEMFEGEESRLAAYRQEMSQAVSRETMTVLPEDRQLKLRIQECGTELLAAQYEIRSMDLNRLVERTSLEEWETGEDRITMVLPIQNLLARETEYLLHFMIETRGQGVLHYYTRILWTANDYGPQMMTLAREFSVKSLSADQAGDLVTYLETSSTADNSSLGHVSIKSSFSQLTWAGLDMRQEGAMEVILKDLDGIMGQIDVRYQLSRQSEIGETEYYEVTDHYTMRWNSKRIYMMAFDRVTNQIFSGERELYSGRRLMLGIGNDQAIQVERSANGRYLGFVFNRDVWCYDQKEAAAAKVFSFRSSEDDGGRSRYDRHNAQIVRVSDEGDMDFLVYGYMNRGLREGNQGVSLYRYQNSGAIEERFFIPSTESFDEIRLDMEKLSYCSESGMLYLFQNQAVFGIDLSSNEYMVVADGLMEGGYAVSSDGQKVAWQEGSEIYQSAVIHLFDLATGVTQELKGPEGSVIRCLGFVQDDFVYGLAEEDGVWILNGRPEGLPMYALEIVGSGLKLQTRYEKEGYYISNVEVEEARVHMDRYRKDGEHSYTYVDKDTIVCNTPAEESYMEGVGWFASEIRRKLYFVQLDSEVSSSRNVGVSAAKRITYDSSETLLLKSAVSKSGMNFYAYGQGRLLGVYGDFSEAVERAYDEMGLVTDTAQRILWNRVDRGGSIQIRDTQRAAYEIIRNLGNFQGNTETDTGVMLLDARGLSLSQVLYFIGQGYPVLAYTEYGSYVLLNGFDQYNVSIFYPDTEESAKMGLNDGGAYFADRKNDFICAVRVGD